MTTTTTSTTTATGSTFFVPRVTGHEATDRFIDWTMTQEDTECRKWAYEVEHHAIGQVAYQLHDLGLETVEDGSINVDCACECEECQHSCDCQHCEKSDYPDHCAHCQDGEAKPSQPCTTTHDGERLIGLSEALEGLWWDQDDCGGHIHVNASDMSPSAIALVMSAWDSIQDRFQHLIGRDYGHYCQQVTDWEIEQTRTGKNPSEKYRAVNVSHIMGAIEEANAGYPRRMEREYKTTIEFRQFAGSIDYRVIIARGYLVRALVDYFAKGGAPYWLNRCQNIDEVRQILDLK